MIMISNLFYTNIFDLLGYREYLDTEFTSSKSMVSIIYIIIVTVSFYLIIRSTEMLTELQRFYSFLLISILFFANLAIVSGRLTMFSILLEPFVLQELKNTRNLFRLNTLPLIIVYASKYILIFL